MTSGKLYSGTSTAPEAFDRAQGEVPKRLFRPASLLDRDGVLNEGLGYFGSKHSIQWIDGAMNTVRFFNDRDWYVFVVTNQAGVARGYCGEANVFALHEHMQAQLGTIEDLMGKWPIDRARSIMIGDKDRDIDIARAAGIRGHKFSKGSLLDFVSTLNPRGRS